ncbi:hypothetical protein GS597_01170 [Synechococcales cyanobacterium C]|uniref:Anaphase-promoting complex subunit 4 WD40 domain-containing protein n=1 Tax=Petrachloros mirabilis ULC683 TaxID=2781853 RepID=A0A8K2A6G1_9CYAN|nr:hypothetical protein [Petrachloros mirabilis]NCJ05150.1 hypothetical protein [Petrachloros mirabilis ULC683]
MPKRIAAIVLIATVIILVNWGIFYVFAPIQPIATIQAHSEPIEAIHFSPDGDLITTVPNLTLRGANRWNYGGSTKTEAMWGVEGATTVKQWHWQTATPVQDFSDPLGLSNNLVFSPSLGILASQTKIIHLWEVASGRLLAELDDSDLQLVDFDHAQARLFTTTGSTVQQWNATTGDRQQTLTMDQGQVSLLAFSANGHILAAGHHHFVQVWNLETAEILQTLNISSPDEVRALALSPNGDRLAIDQGNRLVLMNVITGRSIASVSYSDWLPNLRRLWLDLSWTSGTLAFSPDGNRLALRVGSDIWLMRGSNGRVMRKIKLEPKTSGQGVPRTLTFSPDGRLLAMGDYGGSLHLWQLPQALLLF